MILLKESGHFFPVWAVTMGSFLSLSRQLKTDLNYDQDCQGRSAF